MPHLGGGQLALPVSRLAERGGLVHIVLDVAEDGIEDGVGLVARDDEDDLVGVEVRREEAVENPRDTTQEA